MRKNLLLSSLLFLFVANWSVLIAQCDISNTGTATPADFNTKTLSLGSGESRNLAVVAGERYVFSSNTTVNTNGMCIAGTSVGTSHTYIAPMTGNISIGMFRSSGWSATSATLSYRKDIAITYPASNTLYVGTAATVTPTFSGGTPWAGLGGVSTTQSTLTSGVQQVALSKDNDFFFVANSTNNTIYKVDINTGVATFLAGGTQGTTNGTGASAQFWGIVGIAVNKTSGNLYVIENGGFNGGRCRQVTPAGVVTTIASGNLGFPNTYAAIDGNGNIYYINNTKAIGRIPCTSNTSSPTFGTPVPNWAGNYSIQAILDGTGSNARFKQINGKIAIDASNNLYVTDLNLIRKITTGAVVTTIAGNTNQTTSTDGIGTSAYFTNFSSFAFNAADNSLYGVDGNAIRKIDLATIQVTTLYTTGGYGAGWTMEMLNGFIYGQQTGKILKTSIFGYSITPALPVGLALNQDGSISGTPQGSSEATTYTIKSVHPQLVKTATTSISIINDQLSLTTGSASNITETSAAVSGAFAALGSLEVIPNTTNNLTSYGQPQNIGKVYTLSTTGTTGGTIWGGNNIYTNDSKISKAAVHAGILADNTTGQVYLKLLSGATSYPSTTANGITSSSWGAYSYSYQFVSAPSNNTTAITAKGIAYGTSPNPTTANSIASAGTGSGDFSANLTGLTPGTTYYARAYATNTSGTYYGAQVSFTTPDVTLTNMSKIFGDPNFNIINPTSPSAGSYAYSSSNTAVATVSGNTVQIVGAGTTTITATQAASGVYGIIVNTATLTVSKADQVLTLNIPANAPLNTFVNGSTLLITGSSSASLPVTVSDAPTNMGTLTATGTAGQYTLGGVASTGTVTFTASATATANYNAASISQSMDVTLNNQTITFNTPNAVTYASGSTVDISNFASASSGLSIIYTVVSGPGTLGANNILSINGAGSIVITASQPGDASHNPASSVTQTLVVDKANPTITFANISKTYGDLPFTPSYSSNSNGNISWSSSATSVASTSGNYVSVVGAGTATITLQQAESDNYLSASVTATLTVSKATQTITHSAIADLYAADFYYNPIALTATTSSGLPLTFTVNAGGSATVVGSQLNFASGGNGSVTLTISQSGDANYEAATSIVDVFNVLKYDQTLTVTTLQDGYVGNSVPFTYSTNAAISLDPTITYPLSVSSSIASVLAWNSTNATIDYLTAGTATITVSQAGDDFYNSASTSQTISVSSSVSAPTVNATTQSFCTSATVANLDAQTNITGATLAWYSTSSGGTALSSSTAITNSTYYVAQISGSTESVRIGVTVVIETIGSVSGASSVCSGTSTTLTASGFTGAIQWQISTNGGSTYSDISGQTSATLQTSALTSQASYRYMVTTNACVDQYSNVNSISIDPLAVPGTLSGGATVCQNDNVTLTLAGNTGSIEWQVSLDNSSFVQLPNSGTSSTEVFSATSAGTYYFRAAVTNGCGTQYSNVQTVVVDQTSIPGVISGAASVCPNATALLSLTGNTGTIDWKTSSSLNGTYTSLNSSASTYTTSSITAATYYKVSVTNGVCPAVLSDAFEVGITTMGLLSSISGSSTATPGTPLALSVTQVNGATSYVWDLPAGLTIASSSNNGANVTITVSSGYATGIVKVKAVNSCGETPWQTKIVNAPGQTGMSISGTTVVCGGSNNVNYSVPAVSGASYQWTLPTGLTLANGSTGTANSIQVNFTTGYVGGTISCVRSTATSSNTASIIVGGISTPGSITGSTVLCGLTSTTYSIGSVPNATSYQWQLPIGMTGTSSSNSITASISGVVNGNIQVRAVGTCGTSAWKTLTVGTIATPSTISGPTVICGAATYTITGSTMTQVSQTTLNYSVTNVSGTTYAWTVPTGMTISSGQGTNSIVVSVDASSFTSGQVSVSAASNSNTNCVSSARTLSVVKSVATITGPTSLCGLTTATYSVPSGSGSSYTWTLPGWMTLASGSSLNSNSIIVEFSATGTSTQNISVEIVTSCGNVTVSSSVGCGLYTQLSSAFCGATIGSFGSGISADNIASASSYKFEITPDLTGATTYYLESTDRWIALSEVTNLPLVYNTDYAIKVSIQFNGTWMDYGASCVVTTPVTPGAELSTAFCDATLSSLTTAISANNIQGATMYRFNITPSGGQTSYTVDSPDRWFALSEATNMALTYGTVYNVTVAIQNGGAWGAAGTSCSVTTPSLPTTTLSTTSCGATLTSLSASISANNVLGVTMYRFTITPNIQNASSYIVNSPDRWFALTEATGMSLLYGTTYNVTVTLENGSGIWGTAGTACTVTTPAIPTIGLSTASCDVTLQSLGSGISATNVAAATQYEFQIINQTVGQAQTEYYVISPDRWITLSEGLTTSNIPLVPQNNQEYVIRVRVYSGTQFGEYAEVGCVIHTPVTQGMIVQDQDPQLHEEQTEGLGIEESSNVNAIEDNQVQMTTWLATATSNPFAHSFQIKLNGAEGISSAASFTAQLTDMSGKVYSQATLSKEQLEAESFGEQLAPGMYLMTLRQGEELRVIRVVKR